MQTKDHKKVAELYCGEDLSFLPTVSPNFIQDTDKAEEYFEAFVQKQPCGTIVEDTVQSYDSGSYLHTGMYVFDTVGGPVKARFSYMWRKTGGMFSGGAEWKIVHHHSSVVPADPAAVVEEIDLYPVAQVRSLLPFLLLSPTNGTICK